MARRLVPNEVWELVEPLLPQRPVRLKGGRPPVRDRDVLTGILFVLKTGIPWEHLPEEMGSGCGMTCLRRLREWQRAGAWHRIQPVLASHLREAHRIDWSRAGVQSSGTSLKYHQTGGDHQRPERQPRVQVGH